jgi:2-methylcitrate dehydratase PrpD
VTTDVTARIADFVPAVRYDGLPPEVRETAKVAVLDCLGVALAGSRAEDAGICAELVKAEQARDETSVYGRGFGTSALRGAFANGVAAHAEDFDHSFAVGGQPTAPVIPATMALAEALGASGRQVLEATVAGFEVTAALAFSVRDAAAGWHANGTAGIFGAMAACGRLLQLTPTQMRMAAGIATSLASGVSANFGTMTKPLHVGHAAANGMLASKLAQAGYTANAQALQARNGYYAAFYPGATPDTMPFEGLGESFALATHGIRIKPYPCGGLTHTAIDAALRLRQRHAIAPEAVEAVDVDVMEATYNTIAFRVPATGIEGKFCMGYLIARALIDGNVTLDAFSDEAVRQPAALDLLQRVEMRLDPALKPGSSGARSARVSVRLRSGETFTELCESPKGSRDVPMTAAEMEGKYRECAGRALEDDAIGRSLEMIGRLEDLEDAGALCRVLRGSPDA